MPLPTLLVPGKLVIPDNVTINKFMNQPAEDVIPIKFILTWVKRKMSEYGGLPPKYFLDRVLVLQSMTASGKSTVLPTTLLRLLSSMLRKGGSILVTEPRIAVALDVAHEQRNADFNRDLKDMIGVKTGPIREFVRRGLIYATIGVLNAQLKTLSDEKIIEMYKIIIIDECHIRSIQLDSVFIRLKEFYKRCFAKGLKEIPFLILTSATFDLVKYARFFQVYEDSLSEDEKERVKEFGCSNIISVTGRTYPVITNWPEHGTNDYMKYGADLIIKIHRENLSDEQGKNDVLFFVPGAAEGKNVAMYLDKANIPFRSKSSKIPPFIVIYIDSRAKVTDNRDHQILQMDHNRLTITSIEDQKVLLKPFRRVICASVAVEVGVTIESLKYVLDCGYNRASESYFPWGFKGLTTRPATQSMITQRKGRAGRLYPGQYDPTYTENSYKSLPNNQLPDITLNGSDEIFLDLVNIYPTINQFDMLDRPAAHALHYSVDKAIKFGFINGCGPNPEWHLTEMGKVAGKFSRIEMFEARMLFMSLVHEVNLFDMINIVCIIGKTRRDFMIMKKDYTDAGYWELLKLSLSRDVLDYIISFEVKSRNDLLRTLISCELIEYSMVIAGFMKKIAEFAKSPSTLLDWCEKNSIKYDGMVEILTRREDIINDLVAVGIDPWKFSERKISMAKTGELFKLICRIKQCTFAGLSDNVLTRNNDLYWNKGKKIEVDRKDGSGNGNNDSILVGAIRITQVRSKSPKEPNPLTYKLVGSGVCVLDGYIDDDETLELSRTI